MPEETFDCDIVYRVDGNKLFAEIALPGGERVGVGMVAHGMVARQPALLKEWERLMERLVIASVQEAVEATGAEVTSVSQTDYPVSRN